MAFDLAEALKGVSVPNTQRERFAYLPYAALIPDENNGYSMTGIEELARSIELVGLQQPLRVKDQGDGTYKLISGHRRHAAISALLQRDPKAFADGIPCVIDAAGGSEVLRELQLLLANADNRKLTPADELQQTQRISDCLRRLEDEGFKFPGRHRDWVSKMSGMSRSKIARLDAIKNHLSTSWLKLFTEGKLTETVAYAIQQIPERYQELLYSLCVSSTPRVSPTALTEYTAKGFAESVNNAEHKICPVNNSGEPCIWKEQLIKAGNQRPGWSVHYGRCSSCNRCSSCCATCDRLAVCETVCPKMQAVAKEKAEKKQEKEAAEKITRKAELEKSRQAYSERCRKEQEIRDGMWARLSKRRRELGLSLEHAYLADELDGDEIADMEQFETDGGADEDPLDFFGIYDPEDICALADRLQCSLDYVFGRSDEPRPVSTQDTKQSWQTGEPEAEGWYAVKSRVGQFDHVFRRILYWVDGEWFRNPASVQKELGDLDEVLGWYPLPEED